MGHQINTSKLERGPSDPGSADIRSALLCPWLFIATHGQTILKEL
jgi:hypothetical protein